MRLARYSICSKCKHKKPISAFYKRRSRKCGVASSCKDCSKSIDRVRHKKYRASCPKAQLQEYGRRSSLKYHYGISIAQYDEWWNAQHGLCAICNQTESEIMGEELKRLTVDHRHSDDKIRGLLCANCNRALGGFRENIKTLKAAIEYLGGSC